MSRLRLPASHVCGWRQGCVLACGGRQRGSGRQEQARQAGSCRRRGGYGAAASAGAVFRRVATGGVLGTTLRAIGRGFGIGTFGLAQASTEMADRATASARPVASAVDRNAAARAERVTAFLCGGESFNG